MGRKSSDGNSSSTVGATATVMGLRMIQCGRQTVDVIQPDGQVRQFVLPVKVSDLLLLYPHHFVSHATTASATAAAAAAKRGGGYASTSSSTSSSSSSSSIMLPSDAFLETGSIYVILPLPRLFPLAPPPTPHLCSCFYPLLRAADESTTSSIAAAIKAEFKRHWPVLGGSAAAPAPSSSFSSRISPEDHSAATSSGIIGLSSSSPLRLMPRRLWEPALEIISEDRLLVLNSSSSSSSSSNNAFSTSSSKDKDDYHHDYCSSSGPKQDNQLAKKLVSVVLNLNKFRSPPPSPTSTPPSSSSSSSSPPSTTAA